MSKQGFIVVIALALLSVAGDTLGKDTYESAREAKAWARLTRATLTNTATRILQYLDEFIRTYPEGDCTSDARFAIGETHFQRGRYKDAFPHFQMLINEKCKIYSDDALLRSGEIHYNLGNIRKANKTWKRIDRPFKKSAPHAEALYGIVVCDLYDQKYREAINGLDRLIDKYPAYGKLSKVRTLQGILRFREKKFRDAVQVLEGINTPVAAFYQGLSFFQQKQYQDAAQSFNNLVRMPSNPYSELGAYLKAECFRMVENHALAATAYGAFVISFPGSALKPQSLLHQARALGVSGERWKALKILQGLRSKASSEKIRIEALHSEVELAARHGKFSHARSLIKETFRWITQGQSERYAHIHFVLGYYLIKVGRIKEAAATMRELLRKLPGHPFGMVAHIIVGYEASTRNDWPEAFTAYETALLKYDYTPLSDVAMAMMLVSHFKAGNYQELATQSNRIMKVVASQYAVQDLRWRAESHLLIAEAYYQLKQYSEASRFYEEAVKDPVLVVKARLYLAWSKYHEGKYPEALRLAHQVLVHPESSNEYQASARFLTASSHFNLKDYEATIESFRNLRKYYPRYRFVPESWLYEGWAHRQIGNYGDVLQTWKKLVRLFPKNPVAQNAQMQIGRLYFRARDYKKVVQTLSEFLKKWPRSPMAADALWLLAQTYYNTQNNSKAIETYNNFLAQFPKDARKEAATTQKMLIYYRRASSSNSPRLLSQFVRLYPDSKRAPEAQYQLGQMAYESEDWDKAVKHFRKLLLDYPGTSQASLALLAVAHAQERLGKSQAALREYNSLIAMFPNEPAALDAAMRAGALSFSMGKYEEAAKNFRFVTEREAPQELKSSALYNLAVAYKKQRSYAEATEAFERFAKSYPKDPKQPDALLEVASFHRIAGETEKALKVYARLLKKKELTSIVKMEIYNNSGKLLIDADDKDRAIKMYNQLIPLKPAKHDKRLLGLAQLAAIYEEKELWKKVMKIYVLIQRSGGNPEWVRSAGKRAKDIQAYLRAQEEKAKEEKAAEKKRKKKDESKKKVKAKKEELPKAAETKTKETGKKAPPKETK